MRISYLVTAVMVFASAGAAIAQEVEGVLDVTATGGGANVSARAAARMERRELRREQRTSKLEAIRAARSLQARQAASLSGFAAEESEARLMMVPQDEAGQVEAVEPAEPTAKDDAHVTSDSQGQVHLLSFFGSDTEADAEVIGTAEGELLYQSGPAGEGAPESGENPGDNNYGQDETGDDEPRPSIYILNSLGGEVFFRGNAEGSANPVRLFAPLHELRASANSTTEVRAEVSQNAAARAQNAQQRAADALARRLAQIDEMRDRALAEGNAALLDAADRLETTARAQFAAEATIGSAAEPAGTANP